MRLKIFSPLAIAALSVALSGCVPTDAEIASDMQSSRREAYMEWKSQRDRGLSREARVDGPLSLDDAIKMALQYNKGLQQKIQDREVTRGDRITAYSVVLPSVTVSGSANRRERHRDITDIDAYSTGVTVRQPIFEGEAIPAKLRQARFYTALTDEEIRQTVQELIQAVANNYYDVLLAQHLVETHREALISAESQYRMVSEKRKQETATDYDVLRAQVDVATYRARMLSQQNAVDTNRVQLLKNMGVSQDSEISFSDKLQFLPMRPVFERAVEIASGNRPDLRQAELTSRIYQEAVAIARSAFWPKISGSFTQNWSDGFRPNDTFARNSWNAGLGAEVTFGADKVGDLVKRRAQSRQMEIAILDKQEEAMRQIRQEINNLANAEEMIKALEVNQDAAREALRLVEVGYQAGVKTEVDITDARKALTDVQGEYYTSLADHTKARLNLQVAMGVLGPTCITDGPPLPPRVPIANIEEFAATDYEPPLPIPMPTAADREPVTRSWTDVPISQAPAAVPAPAPAVAPSPSPVEAPQARAASPVPPAEPTALTLPVAEPATEQVVAAAPVAEPETPVAQPLFRIKTRTQSSDGTELARAR